MKTYRLCVAAIILWLICLIPGARCAPGLQFKAGLGYDFLSHEYFFDSLLVDTLEAGLATTTTFLDDFKGQLNLSYAPDSLGRLVLRANYEQTSEMLRVKFYGDSKIKWQNYSLEWKNEVDWRSRYREDKKPGDSYIYGQSRTRFNLSINDMLLSWWQVSFDFVRFDTLSSYNFNHYRLGGKAGLAKTFDDFSFLDFSLFVLHRRVPDSLALNYLSAGCEGSFFGFYEKSELDIFLRLEHRNYNKPDNLDDYYRCELDSRHKITVLKDFYARQELELELAFFDERDLINQDYTRFSPTVQAGIQLGDIGLWLGPKFEYLAEQEKDYLESTESYLEYGLKADIDIIRAGCFFGTAESLTGYRNLKYENDLQSNFSFERLNLIADWNFYKSFNFNVLFSAEWEWHGNKAENSQIFLLSSGLSYSF